jgi:hypothetical protein
MIGDLTIYVCIGTIVAIMLIAYGGMKLKVLACGLLCISFLFGMFQINYLLKIGKVDHEINQQLQKHLICNYLFLAFLVLCLLFMLKSMFF